MKKRILSVFLVAVMLVSMLAAYPMTVNAATNTFNASDASPKITTYADLLAFKSAVDGGNKFAGTTITLEADIALEGSFTAIGPNSGGTSRYFSGIFDGKNHTITFANSSDDGQGQYGLFRRLDGATVKNLKLNGSTTISTKDSYAAALAMEINGNCLIQNVHSSVNFSATCDVNFVGGLVSYIKNASGHSLTIDGCIYDGKMNFPNMTKRSGGFVGYFENSGASLTIKNSVYAGTIMLNDASYSYQVGGFVGWGTKVTMTDCVSVGKITFNTTKTWTDTGTNDIRGTLIGEVTTAKLTNVYYFDIGAPKGYTKSTNLPMICKATNTPTTDNVAAKSATDMVNLSAGNFSADNKFAFKAAEGDYSYYPCPASLAVNGVWPSSLTRTIGADLIIKTADDLIAFATAVNNGDTYADKLVVLGADIDLTGKTWSGIGVACSKNFSGTFDGRGHTVNIGEQTYTYASGSECNIGALFNSVQNATLKNVNVTGRMTVSGVAKDGVSGFCAYTLDTVTIENVRSSVYIRLESEKSKVGGIVAQPRNGNAANLTIDGCIFDGTLNFVNYAQKSGGIIGYTGQNSNYAKTITIKNTVFAGTINLNDPTISYEIGGFIGQVYSNGTSKAVSITLSDNIYAGNIFYASEKAWEKTNYYWGAFIGGLGADYEGNLSNAPGIKTVNANNLYYITRDVPGNKTLPAVGLCATTIESLGANVVNASTVKTKATLAALTADDFSNGAKFSFKESVINLYCPCPTGLVPAEGWLANLTVIYNGARVAGAQIRCADPADKYSGIRFVTYFDESMIENAGSADANFGIILISKTKYDALSDKNSVDAIKEAGVDVGGTNVTIENGIVTVKVVVYNIAVENYKNDIVAVAYIGNTVIDSATRSIYQVATLCVADVNATDDAKNFSQEIINAADAAN